MAVKRRRKGRKLRTAAQMQLAEFRAFLPRATRDLSRELQYVPSTDEIAAFLDIDPAIVERELRVVTGVVETVAEACGIASTHGCLAVPEQRHDCDIRCDSWSGQITRAP